LRYTKVSSHQVYCSRAFDYIRQLHLRSPTTDNMVMHRNDKTDVRVSLSSATLTDPFYTSLLPR